MKYLTKNVSNNISLLSVLLLKTPPFNAKMVSPKLRTWKFEKAKPGKLLNNNLNDNPSKEIVPSTEANWKQMTSAILWLNIKAFQRRKKLIKRKC